MIQLVIFAENMTRTKELPPLVLKALEKGQLSSAEIGEICEM